MIPFAALSAGLGDVARVIEHERCSGQGTAETDEISTDTKPSAIVLNAKGFKRASEVSRAASGVERNRMD